MFLVVVARFMQTAVQILAFWINETENCGRKQVTNLIAVGALYIATVVPQYMYMYVYSKQIEANTIKLARTCL